MAGNEKGTDKQDPELLALQGVHAALKGLSPEARRKVLVSVAALLEIPEVPSVTETRPTQGASPTIARTQEAPARSASARPLSIRELMQEKSPGTNVEKITLFAYYREKYEGISRFSRRNLEEYFVKARETPPKNFDRDFNKTVLRGWIHEDGEDSYLTSKGLEAVESGFPNERAQADTNRRNPKTTKRKSRAGK